MRYHRPLTLALLRIASRAITDEVARALRPMDVLVRDADTEYLLILPELSRGAGRAAVDRLVGLAHRPGAIELRAAVLCPDDGTTVEALLAHLRAGGGVRGHLATIERSALVAALAAARGNQTHAARALGVTRRAVIYKMEKFGLKPRPPSPRGRRTKPRA